MQQICTVACAGKVDCGKIVRIVVIFITVDNVKF